MSKEEFEQVESLLSEAREKLSEALSKNEVEEFKAREAYLNEFERVCSVFGVEIELDEDSDKDDVYSEWNDTVNMSASDLKKWSKNPCSRQASQKPVTVIKRNLRLLERNKGDWTSDDFEDAKRTISFVNRMKGMRPDSPREGPHGCPSEWAISLLNWAFNPFDSVPTPSSDVKDDLDPVEEVTLQSEVEELNDSRKASRIVHGDQKKHLGQEKEEDDSVRVPPVAIHKVEAGKSVEVSDDVEKVLDSLWEENSKE